MTLILVLRPSKTSRYMDCFDPSTGEVIAQAPQCTPEEVESAIAAALFGFTGHKNSFFGDLHAMGTDGLRFFTEQKNVPTYWSSEEEGRDGTISFPDKK